MFSLLQRRERSIFLAWIICHGETHEEHSIPSCIAARREKAIGYRRHLVSKRKASPLKIVL